MGAHRSHQPSDQGPAFLERSRAPLAQRRASPVTSEPPGIDQFLHPVSTVHSFRDDGSLIFTSYSAIGQDQTADQLLESFLSWPNDVVRMKVPDGVDSAEFEHSRRLAVWGAFHFQTAKSLIYKGSAQTRIRIPAIAQPYQDHPRDWSEEWTPYPYDRPPVAIARGLLETAKSEIHIIGADFYNSLVYRAENAVELDVDLTTERLLRRLDDFYYGLPGEWRWDVESPPAAHAMPFDIW